MLSLMLYVDFVDCVFFFFKQKTAYEMRISDWSSDVCSSDLDLDLRDLRRGRHQVVREGRCQRLPVLIVRNLLVKSGSDSLSNAADNLPLHDHRVAHGAAILDATVVEDLHGPVLRVPGYPSRFRAIAEPARFDARPKGH